MTTIRAYEPRDLEACRGFWRELTERHREIYDDASIGGDEPGLHFDAYLRRDGLAGPWVAVEDDGAVVGLAGLLVRGTEAEIEPVVVAAGWRSRGIGTLLIRHVAAEARARGVRVLSIRPVARNVEAIACFLRAGFDVLGHVELFTVLGGDDDVRRWKSGIEIHDLRFRY